jgi:hypothetical protein
MAGPTSLSPACRHRSPGGLRRREDGNTMAHLQVRGGRSVACEERCAEAELEPEEGFESLFSHSANHQLPSNAMVPPHLKHSRANEYRRLRP